MATRCHATAAAGLVVGLVIGCGGDGEPAIAPRAYRACGSLQRDVASLALTEDALLTLEDGGRALVKRARPDLRIVQQRGFGMGVPDWNGPTVVSPDGRFIAVSTPEGTVVLRAAELTTVVAVGPAAGAIAFSRDGRRLATTGVHPGVYADGRAGDPFLRVFSLPDGRMERQIDVGAARSFATFTSRGDRVIVGPQAPVLDVAHATGAITSLGHHALYALSARGVAVVRASHDGPLQFVPLDGANVLHESRADVLSPKQVAFSPEGRLAILSTPSVFDVLDVTGGFRRIGDANGVGMDDQVDFAPDGWAFAVREDDAVGLYCFE